MSKYINAEDLINELSAGCMPIYTKGISDIPGDDSCIKDYIDNAPAVNVRPTAPAEWVCLAAGIGFYCCSKCKHNVLGATNDFCPNCGAKMRKEE